jgi:hypothetical protein
VSRSTGVTPAFLLANLQQFDILRCSFGSWGGGCNSIY